MIEDFNYVECKMSDEGFDYCFRSYSDFKEIDDNEFHILRERYILAANELENYVIKKSQEQLGG